MYYIDQLKSKTNMAIKSRSGKVVLSLDETTGLLGEIDELRRQLVEAEHSTVPVEESIEETIYVNVGGGTFKS